MNLNKKLLLVVSVVFFIMYITLSFIFDILTTSGFNQLEQEQIARSVRRLNSAMSTNFDSLNSIVSDYSSWDDAYQYMQDRNTKFTESNFSNSTYDRLKISLVSFIDNNGSIAFYKRVDDDRNIELPLTNKNREQILDIFKHIKDRKSDNGFYKFEQDNIMLSFAPILNSEGSGLSNGWLVMGRNINDDLVKSVNAIVQFPVDIISLQSSSSVLVPANKLDSDNARASRFLTLNTDKSSYTIKHKDSSSSYIMFKSIDIQPLFLSKTTIPRDIHRQGYTSIIFFQIISLLFILVGGAIIIYFTKTQMINRIVELDQFIKVINQDNSYSARVSVANNDEISSLENSFNKMMDNLEKERKSK